MKQSKKKEQLIKVIERQSYNKMEKKGRPFTNPTINLTTTVTLITGP